MTAIIVFFGISALYRYMDVKYLQSSYANNNKNNDNNNNSVFVRKEIFSTLTLGVQYTSSCAI